jgi:hypothetical protein
MSSKEPKSHSKLLGIVGKPNVGKSTFFSAATLASAEIASYPFTTIKPNRGVGYIRTPCVCGEFGVKDNPVNSLCIDGVRLIPVELIDCAGLVPGAWKGRGLGNQFLDEVRKADALIHVVDAAGATDSEGKMCKPGSHDPLEDVRFLETEITMWLVNIIHRGWSRLARAVEAGAENLLSGLEDRVSGLAIRRSHILEALKKTRLNPDKPTEWNEEEFKKFVDTLRRVAKPMLIAANKIDLPTAEENVERLKQLGYIVVPCCAEAELALRRAAEKKMIDYKPGDLSFNITKPKELSEAQLGALNGVQERILRKHGSTGVQEAVNSAFFQLLNMIVVYPVEDLEHLTDHEGRVLPDAYVVPYGTTARGLAHLIHTELGEGFLFAVEARERTRIGEQRVLKDRDVVSIVSTKRRK